MVGGNTNTTQPAPCIRSGRVDHTMVEEDAEPMRNPYTGRIGMTKKKITWKDEFPFSETENQVTNFYMDSGANFSVLGDNWRVQTATTKRINLVGFSEDMNKRDVPIVSALTKAVLSNGKEVLLMVNEGAYTGRGDSLLSKTQAGYCGVHIDEDPSLGNTASMQRRKLDLIYLWKPLKA